MACVSISAQSGSDQEFATLTETVDVDAGEKGGEGIPTVKGGRVWKVSPETDTTITFEGYPVTIGQAPAQSRQYAEGIAQLFHQLRTSWDASQPLEVINSRNRENYRIAILWTSEREREAVNTGITETVLSDSGATWSTNNLVGKVIQMTTGNAKGKTYRVTANAANNITCTGATMLADGTATGDGYRVLNTGKGAVHFGNEGYRYRIANARMINCKPAFTDGILKVTFAFKTAAFTKATATGNITEESGDGTQSPSLPDLGNYT